MSDLTMNEAAAGQAAEAIRPALCEYAGLVIRLASGNLAGLTLFGHVLTPAFDTTRMAARSALVLRRVDLELLRRLGEHGAALGRKHIRAPLVMTPKYISASLDSFPLEMLEIHQRRATLVGEDHFAALEFDPRNVRLQCEREFKRLLILLRQGLLAAAGREKALGASNYDAGVDLLRMMRGLLWLKGRREAPATDSDVVAECERLFGGHLSGVRFALQPFGEHGWDEFTALYADVERLAAVADEL